MNFFSKLEEKAKLDGIVKKVGGGIIKNDKDQILFLKRRENDFMGGILELPSGNIELEETIDEGLIREVKEETNLDVKYIGKFVNTFDYLSNSGKKTRQFNLQIYVEDYSNIFLTEHDEYMWLTIDDIEKNEQITEEVKYAIKIFEYNENSK